MGLVVLARLAAFCQRSLVGVESTEEQYDAKDVRGGERLMKKDLF